MKPLLCPFLLLLVHGACAADEARVRSLSSRIIGGENAQTGRYPYAVSIEAEGRHDCGGSLIAPDLVLSAAHCINPLGKVHINRYNLTIEDGESFDIIEEFVHPKYNFIEYPYDLMIIMIDGNSSILPVLLNRDALLPQDFETLILMGWGRTSTEGDYIPSDVLKNANVTSYPQSVCRSYWQGGDQAVTEDMMCITGKTGFDCRGDSGSPLIVPGVGEDASSDVQVGLATWGPAKCDHPKAPSVYSRISDQIDWIDTVVCQQSSNPPDDFDCTKTAPILSGKLSGNAKDESLVLLPGQIAVSIVLDLDSRPHETGFYLEDENGIEVYRSDPGTYRQKEQAVETAILDVGKMYSIVLLDIGKDGFCCEHGSGSYEIRIGNTQNGKRLLSGTGDFGTWVRRNFFTTAVGGFFQTPDYAGDFPIIVRVRTQFSPQDIQWSLSRVDLPGRPIVAGIEKGRYLGTESTEQEVVMGVEGGLYAFTFTDPHNFHDFYIHVGDTILSGATRVAAGAGETTVTFQALLPENSSITQSSKESSSLSLEFNFDDNPGQVGWYLIAERDDTTSIGRSGELKTDLIAFGPQEEYSDGLANQRIVESIPLPADTSNLELALVVHDAGEDGLCCRHGKGSFKLYRGGKELVSSNFQDQERALYTFNGFDPEPASSGASAAFWSTLFTSTIIFVPLFR